MPDNYNDPLAHFVGYLESARQAQRKAEDSEIDSKISLLHDLINAPGANPARTAQALEDMMALYGAKGGQRKAKKGMAGFMGESEIPTSTLLSGIIHGAIPFQGPTQEAVPKPQSPAEQGLLPPAGMALPPLKNFDGQAVLNEPVYLPPEPIKAPPSADGLLSAARQMEAYNKGPKVRPVANQPMMRAPEELAQEKADAAGMTLKAQMESEFRTLVDMGTDEETARLAVAQKYGLKNQAGPKVLPGRRLFEYRGPDGQVRKTEGVIQQMPDGTVRAVDALTGLSLPPDAMPVQTGAAAGTAMTTDKGGNTWLIDKANGTAQLVQGPQGQVLGKPQQPPQGSVVVLAEPTTGQPAPYRVVGSTARPITLPNGAGGNLQAMKPEDLTKMSAAGKQALVGINVINDMIPTLQQLLEPIKNSNNPIGQTFDLWLAQRGISPGDVEEKLLQTLGIADAYGLRGLMGGRPNMRLMDIVRVHLPQPGDSGKLSWDKIHTLGEMIPRIKQAIIDAEMIPGERGNPYATGGSGGSDPELLKFLQDSGLLAK